VKLGGVEDTDQTKPLQSAIENEANVGKLRQKAGMDEVIAIIALYSIDTVCFYLSVKLG
jgi:hypothetical protein